jgi:hypothetical protein
MEAVFKKHKKWSFKKLQREGSIYFFKNVVDRFENEAIIYGIMFGMVYGRPYERFQKIPHIAIPISCHWNLLFHLLPFSLLLLVTFFNMFSVHGGELNYHCSYKNSTIIFLILYSSTFLSNNL